MQTFLPSPDFHESARLLDWRRLGKQRLEAFQIIQTIEGTRSGWRNHPAVRMWEGHLPALRQYHNAMIQEWIRRGYRNTMRQFRTGGSPRPPPWLGDPHFHASHRSNLLRKDPTWYRQFGWPEDPAMPYVWPR